MLTIDHLSLTDSVNVSVGEKEERLMMTGMHTVADIFCVGCGSIVGWKYVRFGGRDFKKILVFVCYLMQLVI